MTSDIEIAQAATPRPIAQIADGALQMEQSFSVDFEIFGVNTLKPFQYLNLASSGIHPAINGKKIRPTQLEYNLEDDTVKGKGYIIG